MNITPNWALRSLLASHDLYVGHCFSIDWRIGDARFLDALLSPSVPIYSPHVLTWLNFLMANLLLCVNRDACSPPSAVDCLLIWAFNCDISCIILHKIIHKFLRNRIVDQCQPHFFHTVKLLANTSNTIMPPGRVSSINHTCWPLLGPVTRWSIHSLILVHTVKSTAGKKIEI